MVTELPYHLTPELAPLSWLIGSWEGQGRLGSGEADTPIFYQRVDFTEHGLPFVEYHSESWLCDEDGTLIRPLTVETGFWGIDRDYQEADVGPGMTPADVVPAYRSAEDVESLRADENSFPITATITHPGSLSELYYGRVRGPQIQMISDAVMRGPLAGEYHSATRLFGLVNTQLFWRWDVAASEGAEKVPHASAILDRLPSVDEGRLSPGATRTPGQ